jgi:hypothetical protein
MAGDEANLPARDFIDAFAIAAGAGLGCTIHAGEWQGPESRAWRSSSQSPRIAQETPVDIEQPVRQRDSVARGDVSHERRRRGVL